MGKKVGRPLGSGQQLAPLERVKKSRNSRAAAGAVRVDFSIDQETSMRLGMLMQHWRCKSRKEAISRAIEIIGKTIEGKK